MMIDVYVLDKNLALLGVVDSYKSLIWANRYNTIGDCELYLTASDENISLLSMGNYLIRDDDEMICVIKKIEIDTNAENGNYLIVFGYDVKSFLDQRIIWGTESCTNYNLEDFIRKIVDNAAILSPINLREFKKANGNRLIGLGSKAGFSQTTTEQISYKNIGEKIRDYCKTNAWGYRFVLDEDVLKFELYSGTDRSDVVVFCNQYENLSSTKYINDKTHLGNVALIGGAGEGSERKKRTHGTTSSTDRYEIFVDAKDISMATTWKELTAAYPPSSQGGYGYISGSSSPYSYMMSQIDIQVVDDAFKLWLQANYPTATLITIDGNLYYRILSDVAIAKLETNSPDDNTNVKLEDIIYYVYLLNRGVQAVADFGQKISFEGSVIPDVTFTYKQDYFLGDIVSVENEYGISANARIVEVIEVLDENGYRIEPKFEYINNLGGN